MTRGSGARDRIVSGEAFQGSPGVKAPKVPARAPPVRELTRSVWQTVVGGVVVLALFVVTVTLAYTASERVGMGSLRENGLHRFDVYVTSLESEIAKYEYLPQVAELNADVAALLRNPGDAALRDAVNRYLQQVNGLAKSSAIYILDLKGLTLAASNWDQPASFVGMDLSFRPYYREALEGRPGRFYGIGTTSGEPGYYFASGIHGNDKLLGVVALKVGLDKVEDAWTPGVEIVLVADANDVVFLTSVPQWKWRTLAPLPPETLRQVTETRQYEGRELEPIRLEEKRNFGDGSRVVAIGGADMAAIAAGAAQAEFLEQSRIMAAPRWKFIILSNLAPVHVLARNAALIAGFAYLSLFLLFLYLRQRRQTIKQALATREVLQRAHNELEQKVTERTADLREANVRLQREVAERERAEQVLRKAQDDLVQAGKMAVLGQMSAGMTHELNQPLAAMRTLSDNARQFLERNRTDEVRDNLQLISQLTERMGKITGQLKAFARKSPMQLGRVSVRTALANALALLEQRLQSEDVEIVQRLPDRDVEVIGDANRLEQVLVNLVVNALDAMKGLSLRRIDIAVREHGGRVSIAIGDVGPGIAPDLLPRLFEPFVTTKAPGAGLGLGLAISAGIIREFGGTLVAVNRPPGGAEFTIELASSTERSDA